ncbi:MAG: C4-dicarboxylate ABC transporter [Rhodospirillales bacterium CG15_BIG_FIL_POST_REV_8_21_14_020_66_15]|nr:MAG: C4-dicarboxylate ABC transporter [Rhodospirillales bacterium CG15_BIG_FIL_POST_REV_8_21_14_020_66_15]
MRNALIGIVVGLVVGVVMGVSVIAPRLQAPLHEPAAHAAAALSANALSAKSAIATAVAGTPPVPAAENLLAPVANPGPVVRWRMESAFSSALPQLGAQAKRIETEIWRVSAGGMEIAFHEPGSLVQGRDMLAAVKAGTIDAAFVAPESWPADAPALQLFGAVPFGPRAEEYLAWLYFGGGEKLLDDLAEGLGVQIVVCGLVSPEGAGWYRRPLTTVEDLKGLRVRMTGLGAKVMSRLGAKTVLLNEGETFHALETGALDAAEYSMPTVDTQLGLHRMARNYYFPGWHQPATLLALVVNAARWADLKPVQRSQLRAVCGDNVRHGLAEGEAMQYRALLNLTKEGVTVRRWPREILEKLSQAWDEVARETAKRDKNFAKVWKSLDRFRKDYAVWRDVGGR